MNKKWFSHFLKINARSMANSLLGRNISVKFNSFSQEDLVVCSYPRSGSNWFRYMLAFYLKPEISWDLESLNNSLPDVYNLGKNNRNASIDTNIIGSHEPYTKNYPKVIYLVRDGRDVCVSYYYYMKFNTGYPYSFNRYVLDFCSDRIWPAPWHKHVISWLNVSGSSRVFVLRYEDLLYEAENSLSAAVKFLGYEASPQRVRKAVEKASLDKVWGDSKTKYHKNGRFKGGVSGTDGKWKKMFTKNAEQRFMKYAGKAMELCKYS